MEHFISFSHLPTTKVSNKIRHSSRSSSIQRSKTTADQRCLVMLNNFEKFSFPSIEKRWTKDKEIDGQKQIKRRKDKKKNKKVIEKKRKTEKRKKEKKKKRKKEKKKKRKKKKRKKE